MARTKTKSGSKVKVTCPECGKVVTKAGLIGHMAWSHGKDAKRPLLPSKPHPVREARRKASLYDIYLKARERLPLESLRMDLDWERSKAADDKAYMAEAMPLIEAYCEKHKLTEAELYDQLAGLYKRPRITIEDIEALSKQSAKRKAELSGRRKRQP